MKIHHPHKNSTYTQLHKNNLFYIIILTMQNNTHQIIDNTFINNMIQCITNILTPSNETKKQLIDSVNLWGDVENRRNRV